MSRFLLGRCRPHRRRDAGQRKHLPAPLPRPRLVVGITGARGAVWRLGPFRDRCSGSWDDGREWQDGQIAIRRAKPRRRGSKLTSRHQATWLWPPKAKPLLLAQRSSLREDFRPSRLLISRYAETRRVRGVDRARYIAFQLRLVDFPEVRQLFDRTVFRPIATQIGNWP